MPTLRYRIAPLDTHSHLFEVTCTVDNHSGESRAFRLPTWTPGSYLIREFARQFVYVDARCDGQPIAIAKEGKDLWRAAACKGTLEVTAHVYAFDLSVRTAYLDGERAYFNGASVFLCPVGHEDARCTVEIDDAFGRDITNARVATSMAPLDARRWGFGTYAAASYDELIDHPVEIAAFETGAFEAGGVTHDIAVTGASGIDMARMAGDLARVCQWHCDLFGGSPGAAAPFDRYLFLVMAVGDGYGGLEHRASTSLVCRRSELPMPGETSINDDYLAFLGLASHEYFHAWNVKRIKPTSFAPYDLTRESFTRDLWAFEGITSYYDDLSLSRSGVVAPERVLELLGRTLTSVLRTPGRSLQSIADASHDAWIKFYRQDENSPNAGVSYYAKGAIVAMALDLTLRESGSSLDALMRELWQRHGKVDRGVDPGAIARLASGLAGRDLNSFFARYVDGTEDPPLADLLGEVGVKLELRPADGPRDRGGKASSSAPAAWLGALWPATGELRLKTVFRDGPAARAGLSAHDVIVAVDGIRASSEGLWTRLSRAAPGSRLVIDAFRRDRLMHFDVIVEAPPADTAVLDLDPNASAKACERRLAWLGNEMGGLSAVAD